MKTTIQTSDLDVISEKNENSVKLVKSHIDKDAELVYYNGITGINGNTNENTWRHEMAKSKEVLDNIKSICRTTWGDENVYEGPSGKYKWELGRDTGNGIINGVVRKFIAEDKDGNEIYTVAGSFKINHDGEVTRWTGLPRRYQREASDLVKELNGGS